jgi:hypothetical protein
MLTDLTEFKLRLAEAIAWCAPHASVADPCSSLRTPSLKPSWENEKGYGKLTDAPGGPEQTVDTLLPARAGLLRGEGKLPTAPAYDLAGGRLLAYDPDANLFDGVCEQETGGFFDVDNIPPWDTWVLYLRERDSSAGWRHWDAYLVSWVPPQLVEVAQTGIDLNAEECILWLDQLDTPLVKQLVAERLIG